MGSKTKVGQPEKLSFNEYSGLFFSQTVVLIVQLLISQDTNIYFFLPSNYSNKNNSHFICYYTHIRIYKKMAHSMPNRKNTSDPSDGFFLNILF